MTSFCWRRVSTLTLLLAGLAGHAHAGKVEARAGADEDLQNGAAATLATATDGSFSALATRARVQTQGARSGVPFTAQQIHANAVSVSEYTVVGLTGSAPLRLQWNIDGALAWGVDNGSVTASLGLRVIAPGLVDGIGWNINFADGPASMGGFAGFSSKEFGVSAAGSGFVNEVPAGLWDGNGARSAAITVTNAFGGMTGSFDLQSTLSLSGTASGGFSVELAGVTVPAGTALAPGAHLLLDSGQQILITAVPEPETWLMLCAGLLAIGWRMRRGQG